MSLLSNLFSNKGILGINARNLLYIKPYNPEKSVKMADSKIKTKNFLKVRGIPVPKLYGVIGKIQELKNFNFNLLPSSFALKPNSGFGGEGIIPVKKVDKETKNWIKVDDEIITPNEYKAHINDILNGRYAISGVSDIAFFEELITSCNPIGKFAEVGLPDIRVIVYNLIPVMAMLRIPTKESGGKANLHLGAIGVGIDLAKGETTHIYHKNAIIDDSLPENLKDLKKLKIPFWDEILLTASRIQLMTNLGYLAADIVIDRVSGPILLEMNARAGLSVQIANLCPLRKRLEQVESIKVISPEKGVKMAKEIFGNIVEKKITSLTQKEVIGPINKIKFILPKIHGFFETKISLNMKKSIIDRNLVEKINKEKIADFLIDRNKLKVKIKLGNKKISTVLRIKDLSAKKHNFYLGSRDLKDFFIDPGLNNLEKKTALPSPLAVIARKKVEDNLKILKSKLNSISPAKRADEILVEIEKKINILGSLYPLNYQSEYTKWEADKNYSPNFIYPPLRFNPSDLLKDLCELNFGEDKTSYEILSQKRDEIVKKIELLKQIAKEEFTKSSINLYGQPEEKLLEKAKKEILFMEKSTEKEEEISVYEVEKAFRECLNQYGINDFEIKIKNNLIANCLVGKKKTIFLKKEGKFLKKYLRPLIAHEIETHLLTLENGRAQPLQIFAKGLSDYLPTQEGLAIYNERFFLPKNDERRYWPAANYLAVYEALKNGFKNVITLLLDLGFSSEFAFKLAARVKRGLKNVNYPGAFTKDAIYYSGYNEICEFLNEGRKIADLYYGKYNIRDAEKVKSFPDIKPPKYLPAFIIK